MRAPNQLVFDASRNLYVCDSSSGVLELPFGSEQPAALDLHGLSRPIAITIDPRNRNLFVSVFAGAGQVLVFAPHNVNAIRSLNDSESADTLAAGEVRDGEDVFVPDSKSNIVHVFKHDANDPKFTINTPGAHYPFGSHSSRQGSHNRYIVAASLF